MINPLSGATPAEAVFPGFPSLPAEIRLAIWGLALPPRVVELHTRRQHYADAFRHGGRIEWRSRCGNPALLSACREARDVALSRYTVALPLAAPDSAGPVLYLDPERDTVALLGELDLKILKELLDVIRHHDPRGLARLGLSTSCFVSRSGRPFLFMYAATVFRELDELILFPYAYATPPHGWPGGRCLLQECTDQYCLLKWEIGCGYQLKSPDKRWPTFGDKKRHIRIMDLQFV